ncbi:MAG TPA: hypothetical protein VEZ70_01235 [Allosphingosinicella sp.]|nr:hypothetical protein [Allosphingosinicella sp.]
MGERVEVVGVPRVVPNKNRAAQYAPAAGRKTFGGEAREVFLDWFSGTANLSWAARKAGFHYRTVLRHRADDEAFRERFDRALEQGLVRVRAWLLEARKEEAQARAAEAERVAAGLEDEALPEGGGTGAEAGPELAGDDPDLPGGDTAPAHLDAGLAMQMLRDEAQRERFRLGLGGGGAGQGARGGRPPTVASNEEVRVALAKALIARGIRVRAEARARDAEEGEAEEAQAGDEAQVQAPEQQGSVETGEEG